MTSFSYTIALFGMVFFLMTSCQNPADSSVSPVLSVRTSLQSEIEKPLNLKVWVEGPDGQLLSGARVLVTTPENEVANLELNPSTAAYYLQLNSGASGDYIISVRSQLGRATLKIPHSRLTIRPNLSSFSDSSGRSQMRGDVLKKALALFLSWSSVPGAGVYQIKFMRNASVIFTASTTKPELFLDADTFKEAGTYTLQITAQNILGDPLLDTSDYFSFSTSSSSFIAFSLE